LKHLVKVIYYCVRAQQEQWKRIWRGFVAFATTGYDLFQSFEKTGQASLVPDTIARQIPRTAADAVSDLIGRKLPFGQLNHLGKHLGIYKVNDLFGMPSTFMEELAFSTWIALGKPEESRLLSYLTTFSGPMYKVFNADDLEIWRRWIEWLGQEGDSHRPKNFINRGEAMLLLVAELKSQMTASEGHKLYNIRVGRVQEALSQVFRTKSPIEIMKILGTEGNGYVIRYQPAKSALIVDLLRPGRDMGRQLDRRFTKLQGQVGRMVIYEWIAAGCRIPGEALPDPGPVIQTRRPASILLVHQYGQGAVH
jgi:hypothetical protein